MSLTKWNLENFKLKKEVSIPYCQRFLTCLDEFEIVEKSFEAAGEKRVEKNQWRSLPGDRRMGMCMARGVVEAKAERTEFN